MNELLLFLIENCPYLYEQYGFRFVDSRYEAKSFGNAFVRLESDDVAVILVRDRGQILIDFEGKFLDSAYRKWDRLCSIDLVRQLLEPSDDLYSGLMTEDNVLFMREHFDAILDLFSKERFSDTYSRVKILEQWRCQVLFPNAKNRRRKSKIKRPDI